MLRFTRGRGRRPDAKDKLAQELLLFNKTVEHGFPHKPSAVAYDKELRLLAIGTNTGFIKIFGKPGVELSANHTTETRIQELHFLPKQGRVISVCDDVSHDSIHLWEINKKDGKATLEEVKTCTLQGRLKKISVCSLSMKTNRLYLGTEGGNIYLLDINTFDLLDHIIYQDVVVQGVPEENRSVNPGSVEAIQENPQNRDQVLIGYKKGLMVLWNHKTGDLKQSFCSMQGLESLDFDLSGERFVSSHSDGSLTIWNLAEDAEIKCESPCESPCPFGPFPCKAITKVCWYEPYTIFSGGMPRASYGDRHCISVIRGDSTQATFDFTSRVIDFFLIFDRQNKIQPRCLAVLCEHEFVVIDLLMKESGYPQYLSPYLTCLHSSPITCSQHVHQCSNELWQLLKDSGKEQQTNSYPPDQWPITGGKSLIPKSNQHDLLITGHEDGSVRFWDVSSLNMTPIYTVHTAKYFSGDHEPHEQIDGDDEGWPHLRKVGLYDPYCDDQRLGVQKIYFDPQQMMLAVGGHGGQIVLLDVTKDEKNIEIPVIDVNLVKEYENFNWKGAGPLMPKSGQVKVSKGFKPSMIVQIRPASCITALALKTKWGILAAGSTHGFFLLDFIQKQPILHRCTLSVDDLGSEGGNLVRRRTLKESLRRSFRRLRSGRRSGKRRHHSAEPGQSSPSGDELPVQRLIDEKSKVGEGYQGLVRCLYMVETFIKDGLHHSPSLLVGTNSGHIYPYTIDLPSEEKRESETVQAHAKKPEIHLKHNAPILTMFVIDKEGKPLPENYLVDSGQEKACDMSGNHSLIICSEEQFKVLSLPQLRIKHKEKLTAIDGSKARKLGVISLKTDKDDETYYCLGCLNNQGDLNVFSLPGLRLQFKVNCIKREDLFGIQSLLFTRFGQGFYLRSPSEMQRFSLTSTQQLRPECVLELAQGMRGHDEEEIGNIEEEERIPVSENNANVESADGDVNETSMTTVQHEYSVNNDDGEVTTSERTTTQVVAKSARYTANKTTTTTVKTIQQSNNVMINGDQDGDRRASSASSSDGEGVSFKAPGKMHRRENHMEAVVSQ